MTETIQATFDGKVFLPQKPVKLKPNAHVKMTVEKLATDENKQVPFL